MDTNGGGGTLKNVAAGTLLPEEADLSGEAALALLRKGDRSILVLSYAWEAHTHSASTALCVCTESTAMPTLTALLCALCVYCYAVMRGRRFLLPIRRLSLIHI